MEGLAKAGHHITMIAPFKPARNVENYTLIQIDGVLDVMKGTNDTKSGSMTLYISFAR